MVQAVLDVEALFAEVYGKTKTEEEFMAAVNGGEAWLVPDAVDFLVSKISGFGKEREPALNLLCKIDETFIRSKLPDILQPVINMCTDTSKKIRCVSCVWLWCLVPVLLVCHVWYDLPVVAYAHASLPSIHFL